MRYCPAFLFLADGGWVLFTGNVQGYMKECEAAELKNKIIIFHENTDYIIKDGNKTAVAFYESMKKINKNNISLPVYLIDFA